MPSIMSDEEKEIVRRQVPKASNKIQAVAVARLYIAYPNRNKWTNTGYEGAVVLANDLIGNTYWLKLVDMSSQNRGILWDQEIYDTWSYNQDRSFFHTFETEDCLAGLSFADEKEAKAFLKKMNDREKNAHKATRVTPFGGSAPQSGGSGLRHGFLGGFFGGLRNSSAPSTQPTPPESPSFIGTHTHHPENPTAKSSNEKSDFAALDAIDPNWREAWGDDLKGMGITDDLIRDNQDFIADYIKAQQSKNSPTSNETEVQKDRVPPPPPFTAPISPSRRGRGDPPAPPPARRSATKTENYRELTPPRDSSPLSRLPPRFTAPPPLPDAGKYAHLTNQTTSKVKVLSISNSIQQPPPRPPKNPKETLELVDSGSKFKVPPPFPSPRSTGPPVPNRSGPAIPVRGTVPPPPRMLEFHSTQSTHLNSSDGITSPPPPPLPPKIPSVPDSAAPMIPPLSCPDFSISTKDDEIHSETQANNTQSLTFPIPTNPSPPSFPPPLPSLVDSPPSPPPPPMASFVDSPPSPLPPPPPPPPPMPSSANISAPPSLPKQESSQTSGTSSIPHSSSDRSDLLAGIQKAGGIGALRKVDRSQIRDRSQAMIPGSVEHKSSTTEPKNMTSDGGLAGALAAALNKRKQKVSASDDEADNDDW